MSIAPAVDDEVKTDMTPMIDCVFLMIVFFVCIDFRVLEAKLPAYLPKDRGGWGHRFEPIESLTIDIHEASPGQRTFPGGAAADGALPIDAATGRPARYEVQGHTVRWSLGALDLREPAALHQALARIHADRSTWQDDRDHPGRRKPMPVVIQPHPGVYYDDAAATADVARAAGFTEVDFGGGLGARR